MSGEAGAGSNVNGGAVNPHVMGPILGISAKGGPIGSTATMALTSPGRRSATSQPTGPDAECVSRIEGPIRSSSRAMASASRLWEKARSAGSGPYTGSGLARVDRPGRWHMRPQRAAAPSRAGRPVYLAIRWLDSRRHAGARSGKVGLQPEAFLIPRRAARADRSGRRYARVPQVSRDGHALSAERAFRPKRVCAPT